MNVLTIKVPDVSPVVEKDACRLVAVGIREMFRKVRPIEERENIRALRIL